MANISLNKSLNKKVQDAAEKAGRFAAVSSSEVIAGTASAVAYTSKEAVCKAAHGASDSMGFALDTVNRYTKDFADVGNFGESDLSGDIGSLAAGTAAGAAVNSARIAKIPLKEIQIGLADKIYSEERIQRAVSAAEHMAAAEPAAKSSKYWNLFAAHQRTSGAGLNPVTRYQRISVSSRSKSIKHKFLINRPHRMEKRKEFLKRTAHNYRTFDGVRSTKDMLSNQSRKATASLFRGNDSEAISNKVFYDSWNSARLLTKARKPAGKALNAGWGVLKTTGKMLRHPVRTLKSAGHLIASVVSAVSTMITAVISGLFSVVIALMPVIIAVCTVVAIVAVVTSVITFVAGIFTVQAAEPGSWQEIPLCDTGNAIKDWARASQAWNPSSDQADIWNCNQERGYACGVGIAPPTGTTLYGELKKDPEFGFYYYEYGGEKYYTNAVASYYSSKIGDRFRVTTDTGAVFYIVVADQKADIHTKAGNACASENCVSQDGSMLEFYLDPAIWQASGAASMNSDFGEGRNFSGAVTKMEKWVLSGAPGGQMGAPDFSNSTAWRSAADGGQNPYVGLYGQCTWGAWGKFYEIYGFGPTATWNGNQWAHGIVSTYPDRFELSSSPKPGAVYSGVSRNHVGIILDVKPDGTLSVFDANLDGITNTWDVALTDWRIADFQLSDLITSYGGVIFANPK